MAHTLAPLPLSRGGGSPFVSSLLGLWRALVRRIAGRGAEVFSVQLAAGQELRFREAAGWTIACRGGTVWITQEADARDVFLNRGEAFPLDRGGLALVRACRDAVLSMRAPVGQERSENLENSIYRGTAD